VSESYGPIKLTQEQWNQVGRPDPAAAPVVTNVVVLTESDIQRGVIDLLRTLSFVTYHTWLSKHSEPGFPDVFAVDEQGIIVAVECKGPKGRVTEAQRAWIVKLDRVPGCAFSGVVGPSSGPEWLGYDEALFVIAERVAAMRGTG
jgi:hypothetical protein